MVVLVLTTPHIEGPAVLAAQRKLVLLGFSLGQCDGVFGPATDAAVRAFQFSRGLAVDGVVGAATAAALVGASSADVLPQASRVGELAYVEAYKHVGVRESPPGSRETAFGKWYGYDGVRWCVIFASYCFRVGADYTLCDGHRGPGVKVGRGCSYAPTLEEWFKVTGQWVGRTRPRTGDLAIYDLGGEGADHVGIVQTYSGGPSFTAVEGDASAGGGGGGGEVAVRTMRLDAVSGFGRVRRPPG